MNSDEQFAELMINLVSEVVSSRARVRAIQELLVEKGLITEEEYVERFKLVFERDHRSFKQELLEGIKELTKE